MENTISYKSYCNSPYRSIKHSTYFHVYDHLFASYIGESICFVEIGVLEGGSLHMWRDFFGPQARIIGIDVNPNAKKWEDEGFEIFIGSQSDELFWDEFINEVGQVDIVLDDGGHTYAQQIVTTEKVLSHIRDGGMIVVEDTHTSYMDGFGLRKQSFIEYTKKFLDKINYRFGDFNDVNCDRRVWSVQVFESIVAFRVDRPASHLPSMQTDNKGARDLAVDYRHNDKEFVSVLNGFSSRISFLKNVPGLRMIKRVLLSLITREKDKTAKYFGG